MGWWYVKNASWELTKQFSTRNWQRVLDELKDTRKSTRTSYKILLRYCGISPIKFENIAGDKHTWTQSVRAGAHHYEEAIRNNNDQRRYVLNNRQHGEPQTLNSFCQERGCGTGFKTVAGLSNHTRALTIHRGNNVGEVVFVSKDHLKQISIPWSIKA